MLRKILKILGIVFLMLILLAIGILALYYPTAKKLFYGGEIVRPDSLLTIYLGGGGNSVVLKSDSAILVVDTKMGNPAKKLYHDVEALAAGKPVIIVNTHSDGDHVRGNPLYKDAEIISGKVDENYWILNNGKAGMPTQWVTDTLNIAMGDETVKLINMGQAHTWSDIVVYFQKRGLLVTGDLVFNGINTFFDAKKGSNGLKSIEALRRLNNIPGIEKVVPGHGEIGGRELITRMQSYLDDMSLAAEKPELEKAMKKKYKKWASMPGMASPGIVIEYFRKHP